MRLRYDLRGLIAEQQHGCLRWYHRQLIDCAQQHFSAEEQQQAHLLMATYFGNLVSDKEREHKRVSAQPWLLNEDANVCVWEDAAVVNVR